MSTTGKSVVVIGDLQGCLGPLQTLLEKIHYDPNHMILWFAGDLINRGPESLETLRFVRHLPPETIVVLGNHDLSLLVMAEQGHPKPTHDLYPILTASDSADLLYWLRHRPLLHHDHHLKYTLVHAGIYPSWSLSQAMAYAHEVEDTLQAPDYALFLHHLYGNEPSYWDDNLPKQERLRFILNCFTRMRFCEKPLTTQPHHPPILQLHAKGAPEQHPEYIPWFDMPHRVMRHENILFGHWSALETNQHCKTPHLFPLDSGCVWGNALTAYCLNTQEYTRIPCKPYLTSQHSRRL